MMLLPAYNQVTADNMPQSPARWNRLAERVCLAVLFAWAVWLPLPFGSNVERARVPLIVVPLAVCLCAALIRLSATRDRTNTAQPTRAWVVWGTGGLLLLAVGALQLLPLPPSLLRVASPQSHAIHSAAVRIATLAGSSSSHTHPITIDPHATQFEVVRMAALLAAFTAAALLIRAHPRRLALAYVLSATAIFEALYGVREAALQRYEIWGWVNRLIFHRVTGTFVNPNHFAHYLAIVLPMAVFLGAVAWHRTGVGSRVVSVRVARLLEHELLRAGFALIAVIACVAAVLLAGSRGALLAAACGALTVLSMLPGRRVTRVVAGAAAFALLVVTLVVFLGAERTVSRFVPTAAERETFVGRRIGVAAAAGVWRQFPLLGSGAGTFERIVSMEQRQDHEHIYHHAHNDYLELAATTGTVGVTIAVLALVGGYVLLARATFSAAARELTWRRRAFQAAALTSLTIAMIHALVDFNFFIPANPATLALILGASVASVDHDRRVTRRSAASDAAESLPE